MTIIRSPKPENNFTVLANDLLRNSALSYRARGVLACILSRPDNWQTSADQLAREGTEGRTAILHALTELEAAGYVQRRRWQNERGHWASETVVFDEPQKAAAAEPKYGNPRADNPRSDNLLLLEETTKKKHKEDISPNASAVVAAYADAATARALVVPQTAFKRIGADAKRLLADGFDIALLIAGAAHAATVGHANLSAGVLAVQNTTQSATDVMANFAEAYDAE